MATPMETEKTGTAENGVGTTAAAAAGPTSSDYYFDSYSHFGIHEEMLKDSVRTKAYQRAIVQNPHLFKDKVVLDVGCGTGILCMFAAQAGAKHVYGVDMAGIIVQAKQIVEANNFKNITLIRGKVEEIELPVKEVDIIISEWMGYFLIYESMCDTVIYARDRWLKRPSAQFLEEAQKNAAATNTTSNSTSPWAYGPGDGGLIFPDKATLCLCAIEDGEYRENKIDWWKNVYGFNMSCIRELALVEPLVDVCNSKQVITNYQTVKSIDIYSVTKEELDFTVPFSLTMKRTDFFHAFVAYFEIEFGASHHKIRFSTGPQHEYTHWKQTVIYRRDPLPLHAGDQITGVMSCKRNAKNPRDIDIHVTHEVKSKQHKSYPAVEQEYRMR